jgi:drug/metabolite transporter (DMT)-like permease
LLKRPFVLIELCLGLLAMAGIYIIFHFDARYKTGIVAGVFSAMLGSIFPVLNRGLLQRMNAETLMSWEISAGFVSLSMALPLYLKYFPVQTVLPGLSDLMWLLVLSWLCSVWAFQLSANALQKISAFTVNLTYQLEPLYGIVLAFVVYGENAYLDGSFYSGLGLILLAVVLQSVRVYRKKAS